MSESVILCEGFHDRAFWAGWLAHLGCTDPGQRPGPATRVPILDPWGLRVTGGQYAYHSATGQFVRLVPCRGKDNILREARSRLQVRDSKTLLRLIINVDPDVPAGGPSTGATGIRLQDVLQHVRMLDPAAALNPAGEIDVDGGATRVSVVRWEVNDPAAAGLPDQQTLERLVCAALVAAYPVRAKPVQDWLDSRPAPPQAGPKDHAWSYMAGWYAEFDCEGFFTNLWKDAKIVGELESRLRTSGAWQVAQVVVA
jgi:hypothetical protein